MKHVIAFATISACLLVLSGGAALAGNPAGTGEPGNNPTNPTGPGANCANLPAGLPSTGATNATGSPFNTSGTAGGHYAGSPTGGNTSPQSQANLANAFSNYDVACFHTQPH
jgi:hypothetical protein